MAITTRAGLISALAARRTYPFQKSAIPMSGGGARLGSTWKQSTAPAAGTSPGTTAATCDRTTTGAVPLPAPNAGNVWYVSAMTASKGFGTSASLYLFDRLGHVSGLSGTSTSAQTCNVTLPARATDKTQVMIFLEAFSGIGATAVATVTCSYTNQSGTAGKTATLTGGILASSTTQGYLWGPFELATPDTGVTSVETVTLGSSSGTAGDIGIVLARYVCGIPIVPGTARAGWGDLGLVNVGTSPCLWLAHPNSLSSTTYWGAVELVQG